MKIFRKVIRVLFLILVIALACAGMGMPFINHREKYMDKEINIELVEGKDDEAEDQLAEEKE